jgi:hypothetical protein
MHKQRIPAVVLVLGGVLLLGAAYLFAEYTMETFVSDAATRLAYQIRDEASALKHSGQSRRTFVHRPMNWPAGITGAYRVEVAETRTSPRPGHRSIGVARNLTAPTWYSTSYHLNFVEVPKDLVVSHQKGEPTLVSLELKDGKVSLTQLR